MYKVGLGICGIHVVSRCVKYTYTLRRLFFNMVYTLHMPTEWISLQYFAKYTSMVSILVV